MSRGGRNKRNRQQVAQRRDSSPTQSPKVAASDQTHRAAAQQTNAALSYTESYSGLLPHPHHLAGFDEVVPGSAKVIIDEFVAQSQHRRVQEAMVVQGNEARNAIGQWLGFALLLAGIVSGLVIALTVNATVGGSVIGGVIASGALVWVIGGRAPRGE